MAVAKQPQPEISISDLFTIFGMTLAPCGLNAGRLIFCFTLGARLAHSCSNNCSNIMTTVDAGVGSFAEEAAKVPKIDVVILDPDVYTFVSRSYVRPRFDVLVQEFQSGTCRRTTHLN